MPKLYSTYLGANLILPFAVSSIFFVSFLMTFEMFRIFGMMASSDVDFGFMASLMLDVATTLLPMAAPLALYFSIIFALNRMSSDSEYVALRAAGLTKNKIFMPFLFVAAIVSANVQALSQHSVPFAHKSVRKKIKILSSESLIQGIKSGQFFTSLGGITLFPQKLDEQTLELEGVFIHIQNQQESKVIWSNRGKILHDKNETTGLETFKISLNNGNMVTINKDDKIEKILFDEYILPISEKKFSYKTNTKEIMMTYSELVEFIDGGLERAKKAGFKKREYINAKYEYWHRVNSSVLVLTLCFIGFCLGITGNRGKQKSSSGKAIMILIFYYFVYFSLSNLSREGSLPFYAPMLVSNIVGLLIGFRLFKKIDWLS